MTTKILCNGGQLNQICKGLKVNAVCNI
uniref:Uncharacterized protein n=1 Tax=Anguilla anguilla TaxID=7936 RepID=A0A0E9XEF6_ANGAN